MFTLFKVLTYSPTVCVVWGTHAVSVGFITILSRMMKIIMIDFGLVLS